MSKQVPVQNKINDILSGYKYNANKPYLVLQNLSCYEACHKDNQSLKFTIKLMKKCDNDLYDYMKSLKANNSSQFIIKITQLVFDLQKKEMLVIHQFAAYGTLKDALRKCKRFDDDDCLTIAKILLNGHIQMLRQGTYWYGDQNDIEITESGIKLSWNNTFPFSHNNDNPFPRILQRIGQRQQASDGLLPFPKNKMLQDLIKVSRQNASQMSLHPLLKKREKVFKKKGKSWLALKQSKIKGQYQQELSYLAVSKQFGLVRVKVFQKGTMDSEIIKIYQTIPSFVKILDFYDEGNSFITIAEYSNDGSVQSYVKRLKNSNIQLKEPQIQFFFFSLIEPLKTIHKSPVQSLNMLHIKNIYIQDGIVKIGEPIPLSQSLRQTLIERTEIPDFYHSAFKAEPTKKDPTFDTYSLGVLIYKLMYTQYPIFPNDQVHVPTAPAYKQKLKSVLELFLNTGGTIEQIQAKIEVSEDVKNQVKNNEKALQQNNKSTKQVNGYMEVESNQHLQNDMISQLSLRNQQQDQQAKGKGKCARLYHWISKRGIDKNRKYQHLQKSNFSSYRQCTTILLIVLFYFLAFFVTYMEGAYNLFAHTRLFVKTQVTILGIQQTVIIPNFDTFLRTYAEYNNPSVSTLTGQMHCKIDNSNVYYDFVRPQSPHWYLYLFLSLALMLTILILKSIQLHSFSTTSMLYHYYNKTIDGNNMSRFALSSYIFFQLWFGMTLWAFYYLFNFVYNQQHSPCFGGDKWIQLTQSLMTDRMDFTANYFIVILIVFTVALISFLQITYFFNKINYDQLCNPIFIFTPLYLGLLIALRLGAFQKFDPSWLHNQDQIIGSTYMNIVGYFPEILISIEILLCLLIDLVFDKFADKKIQKWLLDQQTFRIDDDQNRKIKN